MGKLNINLHSKQLEVLHHSAKVKVLVCGRGFGKTRLLRASAIKAVLTFKGKFDIESPQEVCIIAPSLKKATELHWDSLVSLFENTPLIKKIDRTKKIIYFKNNLPLLSLAGVDDGGEKLRGKNLVYAGCEEYQQFPSNTWDEIITPCFRDPSGAYSADVVGTPKGVNSHFYNFHLQALTNPDWQYFHFTSADNPFHPKALREQAKLILPPKVYAQEYAASWENFGGQIFDQIENRHLIQTPDPTTYDNVFIGVDWGETNPALSVIGLKDGRYFLFDYWVNPQPGIPVVQDKVLEQVTRLCNLYNVYRVYAPDDRPASFSSLRKEGYNKDILGLKRSVMVTRSKPGVMEGCGILNSLFYQDRLYINKNLTALITDFKSYHKEQDKQGLILEKPAEGQPDHVIDATRYALGTLEYKHNFQVVT